MQGTQGKALLIFDQWFIVGGTWKHTKMCNIRFTTTVAARAFDTSVCKAQVHVTAQRAAVAYHFVASRAKSLGKVRARIAIQVVPAKVAFSFYRTVKPVWCNALKANVEFTFFLLFAAQPLVLVHFCVSVLHVLNDLLSNIFFYTFSRPT